MRFSGKTVIVTGAASGIGADATALFASEGAVVYASDIDVAGGEKLAAETEGNVRFVRCGWSGGSASGSLVKVAQKFGVLG